MRLFRRCTRISILSLLAISVFTPVFLLSFRLKNLNTDASKDFVEDLSILKHRIDAQANSAVQQEEVEGLKGPHLVIYRDGDHGSLGSLDENDRRHKAENVNLLQSNGDTYGGQEKNQRNLSEQKVSPSREKEKSRPEGVQHSRSIQSHLRRPLDEKVKEMKDKVIRAKAYLSFAPPDSNSHFVKEIKLRIKELERAMGDVTKDSGLSRRATQKMKAMDGTLLKASRIYPDCSAMVNTLRAMTYNAEEQLRSQRDQTSFLVQLAARTTPKGLHCLSMRPQNILLCSLRSGSFLTNTNCRIPISITLLFSQTMFWHVLWLSIQLFQPLRYAICVFSHLGSPFFLKSVFLHVLYVLNATFIHQGFKKQLNLGGSEEDTNRIP
ncbi:hypothetical protein H5410_059205 [Solanum commersonii]|uniref:Uncharacterized protein n=1 Tax=Solanum commersonii TaxID=4109 RepID=A0A9J5W241_SOLCO|nr:hypothetical protein H5410_059205 [Solanum commersonii]